MKGFVNCISFAIKKKKQWWFDGDLGLKSFFMVVLIFKVVINIYEYAY